MPKTNKEVSNDTQVKQEAEKTVSEAAHIVRYCARSDIPFPQRQGYVESALATVRREAFKEAVRIARDAAWTTKNHDVGAHDLEECATCAAAMQSTEIMAALERASANSEKGEGSG